jgi:hypothetical protein
MVTITVLMWHWLFGNQTPSTKKRDHDNTQSDPLIVRVTPPVGTPTSDCHHRLIPALGKDPIFRAAMLTNDEISDKKEHRLRNEWETVHTTTVLYIMTQCARSSAVMDDGLVPSTYVLYLYH